MFFSCLWFPSAVLLKVEMGTVSVPTYIRRRLETWTTLKMGIHSISITGLQRDAVNLG
jgi:hypothetical protein